MHCCMCFATQSMWHRQPSPDVAGMLQSLNVAALLLASGMRPSLEDATIWIATMAALPHDTPLSPNDLLLCKLSITRLLLLLLGCSVSLQGKLATTERNTILTVRLALRFMI